MKKINKKIKNGKDEIGKIIFRPSDPNIDNINKEILNIFENLFEFYKIKIQHIKIELVYSRKEFNKKIRRRSTPNWLVGVALKKKIYIFNPSVLEKYSNHKKSDFKKIMNHELCHIFNKKFNKNIPVLIDEGIALFLSNQKKSEKFEKSDLQYFMNNLDKNMSFNLFVKHDGYKISYWIVKNVVNKFNKNELLNLLKKPSLIQREGLLC